MRKIKNAFKNVRRLKGGYLARGKKFCLVVSRFNEYFTRQLLEGALDTLLRHGARPRDIRVVEVPGAFEIPLVLKRLVSKRRFDAVITIAVVIRGETRHFDQVVSESARGVREISQATEVPVILGMIPAASVSQAMRRVGIKQANKGREWALAAIEMAGLMERLGSGAR